MRVVLVPHPSFARIIWLVRPRLSRNIAVASPLGGANRFSWLTLDFFEVFILDRVCMFLLIAGSQDVFSQNSIVTIFSRVCERICSTYYTCLL